MKLEITLSEIIRHEDKQIHQFMRLPLYEAFREFKKHLESTTRAGDEGCLNRLDMIKAYTKLTTFVQSKLVYDADINALNEPDDYY